MSACAASLGLISVSMALVSSSVSEEFLLKNTMLTRLRVPSPLRSRATTVFAKVGSSGFAAITSTASSCSAMPASNAGR